MSGVARAEQRLENRQVGRPLPRVTVQQRHGHDPWRVFRQLVVPNQVAGRADEGPDGIGGSRSAPLFERLSPAVKRFERLMENPTLVAVEFLRSGDLSQQRAG